MGLATSVPQALYIPGKGNGTKAVRGLIETERPKTTGCVLGDSLGFRRDGGVGPEKYATIKFKLEGYWVPSFHVLL